jgi:hypothetical protein
MTEGRETGKDVQASVTQVVEVKRGYDLVRGGEIATRTEWSGCPGCILSAVNTDRRVGWGARETLRSICKPSSPLLDTLQQGLGGVGQAASPFGRK